MLLCGCYCKQWRINGGGGVAIGVADQLTALLTWRMAVMAA